MTRQRHLRLVRDPEDHITDQRQTLPLPRYRDLLMCLTPGPYDRTRAQTEAAEVAAVLAGARVRLDPAQQRQFIDHLRQRLR